MSGYQSIKRYLGETSLERKCRILFGAAMITLIGGAFWGVDRVTERLVRNETRRKGRDSVDVILVKLHWDNWNKDNWNKDKVKSPYDKSEPSPIATPIDDPSALKKEMFPDLLTQQYESQVLKLDDDTYLSLNNNSEPPEDDEEEHILRELKLRQEAQVKSASPASAIPSADPITQTIGGEEGAIGKPVDIEPVFAERQRPDLNEYQYFQPVYFKQSCYDCHPPIPGVYSQSTGEAAAESSTPFRVMKVILPYSATQSAINSTRAILIAATLVTVALAMAALYFIVKYVIVKPLKHLRDVSENISKGDISARANIQTNDEFEQLAASFNKMLTNLTVKETELRTVNEQLDAKVDQLAQLNMRLYETNRVKSDFLANMSHELRTPLNSIIGFSEVLQGIESLSDKQKRYALNIQKSGRLLLEMINDILDLAKMEAGRMDVRPTEFRVDNVVNAQCDMVRSLTEEKNIDLVANIEPHLPLLYQDQAKVQQILTNLLSNAIKFTPDGGRIVVRAGTNDRGLFEMSVADTGVGIAPAERELIFEKFRQGTIVFNGDGLTREYSGTGLGLSIVKELCKLLGGEISFDSELGQGSTFRVQLPWQLTQLPRPESPLTARIDDLTKPRRADYAATN